MEFVILSTTVVENVCAIAVKQVNIDVTNKIAFTLVYFSKNARIVDQIAANGKGFALVGILKQSTACRNKVN